MASSALGVVSAEGRVLTTVMDATYEIWHEGLDRAAYGRWYEAQIRTPWGRAHLKRFALVAGDEVLASAKQYDLNAVLDGRPVTVQGIGAVFTQPAHRGGGYARELIDRLIERAAGAGVEYSLLFSEIGGEYYRRFGFETIPTSEHTLRVAERPGRGAPAMLVRAGEDRDVGAMAAMNRVRSERYRFHLDRDPDLVQYALAKKRLLAGLGPAGAREVQFFVAEEGASAVAYVVLEARGADAASGAPSWTIQEIGDRDPSGARAGAILQTLVARHPAERRPVIRGRLPAGFLPPQISIVDTRPTADVMMIRPLAGRPLSPPLGEDDVLYWQADVF